jgi:hypothetical protein
VSTLTVHVAFNKYSRGDQITDAADVATILQSHPSFVTAVHQSDEAPAQYDETVADNNNTDGEEK